MTYLKIIMTYLKIIMAYLKIIMTYLMILKNLLELQEMNAREYWMKPFSVIIRPVFFHGKNNLIERFMIFVTNFIFLGRIFQKLLLE